MREGDVYSTIAAPATAPTSAIAAETAPPADTRTFRKPALFDDVGDDCPPWVFDTVAPAALLAEPVLLLPLPVVEADEPGKVEAPPSGLVALLLVSMYALESGWCRHSMMLFRFRFFRARASLLRNYRQPRHRNCEML